MILNINTAETTKTIITQIKVCVNKGNMKTQCDFLFIVNYMLADWEDSSMFMSLWLCWSDRVYIQVLVI